MVLASGETAYLRPITPADAPRLKAFHERQPAENRYRRYFSAKPTLTPTELEHFTVVDFHDRVALVLETHGEFAGWASYERWPGRDDAEVAFMVDDQAQGKGIATLFLEHLAVIAQSNGITRFTADVLADNRPMLGVFAKAGWPVRRQFDSGVVELEFPLGSTAKFVETVEQREQRADSRAMARLLLPRSIAVIGASDQPGSVGWQLWRSVQRSRGVPVYAVNPAHGQIGGQPAYAAVTDIEDDVWLAVVAVPPAAVPEVIEQCLAKGVRGAVLVSAPDDGALDVATLVDRARRNGMRIIGPASMGIATQDRTGTPSIQASLAPVEIPPGRVAMSIQSGTLGASLLTQANALAMGLSWFVSLGDKSDVSGNDLLQFWEDDDRTAVIAMYTETFGNPGKFARIARRVSRRRPIVTVRTGPAAASIGADALYEQAGLIQVPTVRDMLDTARVLATQPVPVGPRVAVLTNSRSPGVLAEAGLRAAGLEVVEPPVELTWRSGDDEYRAALAAALADDGIDAVLVIHAPPVLTADTPADEIEEAAAGQPKPVVAVMLGQSDGPIRPGAAVPAFTFPEQAAAVLGRMWAYRRWLLQEGGADTTIYDDVDAPAVTSLLAGALADGRDLLTWDEAEAVLAAYRIPVADGIEVLPATTDTVTAAAERLGYPVAVKAASRGIGRSAEAGVALDLSDRHGIADALEVMAPRLGPERGPVLVQRMVHPGIEVRVRVSVDPQLGPVLSVGLGGARAEAIDDRVHRLPPLSLASAHAALRASRAGTALASAGISTDGLAELIVRLGQVVVDHPEVRDLDANPVIASLDGSAVTDVKIAVAEADTGPGALRRLG